LGELEAFDLVSLDLRSGCGLVMAAPPNEDRPKTTAGAVAPGGDRKRLDHVTCDTTNDQPQAVSSPQTSNTTALVAAAFRMSEAERGRYFARNQMVEALYGAITYSIETDGLALTIALLTDAAAFLRRGSDGAAAWHARVLH
jgi:hypothetical protein